MTKVELRDVIERMFELMPVEEIEIKDHHSGKVLTAMECYFDKEESTIKISIKSE